MSKTVVISITVPDGVTVDVQRGSATFHAVAEPEGQWPAEAPVTAAEPAWMGETFTATNQPAPVQAEPEFAPFPARSNVPPNCPTHHVAMKPSTKVGTAWYCTQKIGPGPKDYCRESVKA